MKGLMRTTLCNRQEIHLQPLRTTVRPLCQRALLFRHRPPIGVKNDNTHTGRQEAFGKRDTSADMINCPSGSPRVHYMDSNHALWPPSNCLSRLPFDPTDGTASSKMASSKDRLLDQENCCSLFVEHV